MYKWSKGLVEWKCGKTLYQSIPFTWLLDDAKESAKKHKGPVVAGGPAVKLRGADWADTPPTVPFDVLSMHNPCATFTSRGCPNTCEFCAVPITEGNFYQLDTYKPAPVVGDNNILEATKKHFSSVIDGMCCFPLCDFNQGLDARKFTAWHASELARLKGVRVRFALDHSNMAGKVKDAIDEARRHGLKDFGVYVLIGFKDTAEDARHRLELVRSWGVLPNPMRYQPLDAKHRNEYVGPAWDEEELCKMTRYYSRLFHLGHIPYEEYKYVHCSGRQDSLFGGE
jgi:hypothetical protein